MRIVGTSAQAGPVSFRNDARAPRGTIGYPYLFGSTVASCLPFGVDPGDVDLERLHAFSVSQTPVATFDPSLCANDAAITAVEELMATLHQSRRTGIGAVIYCHDTIDEDLHQVAITRLCQELTLGDVLAFSVSQIHNCSVFGAMRMARGLLDGGVLHSAMLVLAADKWVYPFVSQFGPLGAFGDAAAAMLLVPDDNDAGFDIVEIGLVSGHGTDPYAAEPALHRAELVGRVAGVVLATLARAGVASADLCAMIGPGDAGLAVAVGAAAGIAGTRQLRGLAAAGHCSSADPIVGLHAAQKDLGVRAGGPVLLWSCGINGEVGCALLRWSPATAS